MTFGYLAALHCQSTGVFSLGLCAVHRQANGQDVQLKVDTSDNRMKRGLLRAVSPCCVADRMHAGSAVHQPAHDMVM